MANKNDVLKLLRNNQASVINKATRAINVEISNIGTEIRNIKDEVKSYIKENPLKVKVGKDIILTIKAITTYYGDEYSEISSPKIVKLNDKIKNLEASKSKVESELDAKFQKLELDIVLNGADPDTIKRVTELLDY